MNKIQYFFLFFLSFSVICFQSNGQDFDVIYLTIGSRHYTTQAMCNECTALDQLEGAVKSADFVGDFFRKYAKGTGIRLFSRIEPHYKYNVEPILLSKELIRNYVDTLKYLIQSRKEKGSKKPIFAIVYYCGHGVSNNLTNATYLIPGQYCDCQSTKDITFEYYYKKVTDGHTLPSTVDSVQFIQSLRTITDIQHYDNFCIYLGDIYDSLKELNIPFMIFADCCLDSDSFTNPPKKNNIWNDSLIIQYKNLRKLNEFREGNPVIFSTTFGKTANTVRLKINGDSFFAGPICSRIYSTKKFLLRNKSLTLTEFVRLLSSSKINTSGYKCYTFYQPDKKTGDKIFL